MRVTSWELFEESRMPSRDVPGRIRSKLPAAVVLFLIAAAAGCDSEPRAPALLDTPVYHNRQEGFRFLVPEGWTQNANANLPPGELEGEAFLVRYRMRTPEMGASLQILCLDDSGQSDLAEHHAGPSFRVNRWEPVEPGESLEIGGKPAERFAYQAVISGRQMTKEVTCFRRGKRVYSFVGLFFSTDDKAREQIRRAVGSVIWER
jgi:hypothetical protein